MRIALSLSRRIVFLRSGIRLGRAPSSATLGSFRCYSSKQFFITSSRSISSPTRSAMSGSTEGVGSGRKAKIIDGTAIAKSVMVTLTVYAQSNYRQVHSRRDISIHIRPSNLLPNLQNPTPLDPPTRFQLSFNDLHPDERPCRPRERDDGSAYPSSHYYLGF